MSQVVFFMEELEIKLLEGQWGKQVQYALRYPATLGGGTAFDRCWQRNIELVRRQCGREQGRFPTRYASEWQETRRDSRLQSGFLEISRCIGYGDWTLWRVSATFSYGGNRQLLLYDLLGRGWKQVLWPLAVRQMAQAQEETLLFANWQRRMAAAMDARRFYLTDTGLCLWFPQQVLGPKNAGLPTVHIPYDQVQGLQAFSPED